MLLICTKCKEELECVKNGVGLDYGCGHVYASDLYACPGCGAAIAKANTVPHQDPDHTFHDTFLDMTTPRATAIDTQPVPDTVSDDETVVDRLTLVAAVDAMIDALRYMDGQHIPTDWTAYAGLVDAAMTLGNACGYDWTEDCWPLGLTAALLARED